MHLPCQPTRPGRTSFPEKPVEKNSRGGGFCLSPNHPWEQHLQDATIWPLWPLQLWLFEMGLLFAGCMYAVQNAEQTAQKRWGQRRVYHWNTRSTFTRENHIFFFIVVLILLLNLPQGIFWLCSGETLKEALEPAVVSIGSPDVSPHKAFRQHGYSIAELLSPFTLH